MVKRVLGEFVKWVNASMIHRQPQLRMVRVKEVAAIRTIQVVPVTGMLQQAKAARRMEAAKQMKQVKRVRRVCSLPREQRRVRWKMAQAKDVAVMLPKHQDFHCFYGAAFCFCCQESVAAQDFER